MNLTKSIDYLKIIGLFTLFIFITVFLIFCSDKGVDYTDESFNILFANVDQEHNFALFNHDLIFKFINIFFEGSFSIKELRLIRLFSLIVSGGFLLSSIKKCFNFSRKQIIQVSAVFLLSIYTTYARGTLTLEYNSIILIFSFLLISFFIRIQNEPSKMLNYFFVAFLLFLVFITKFTSSFLLIGFIFLFFIYDIFIKKEHAWKHLLYYSGSLIIVFIVAWIFIPQSRFSHIVDVMSNSDSSGYSLLNIFISANTNFPFIICYGFLGYGSWFVARKSPNKLREIIFGLISLVVYVNLYIVNWNLYGQDFRLSLFAFFLVGSSFNHVREIIGDNYKKMLIILLVFPLILFAGTNNVFLIHIYTSLPLLYLFSYLVNQKLAYNSMVLLLFVATLMYELRDNILRYPYRQKAFEFNTELINYKGSNHYVTKEIKKNIESLNSILAKSNVESDYILGVSKLIGEVVFSGKTFPSTPLWNIDGIDKWLVNNELPNVFFIVCNLKDESEFVSKVESHSYQVTFLDSYYKVKSEGSRELIKCFIAEK